MQVTQPEAPPVIGQGKGPGKGSEIIDLNLLEALRKMSDQESQPSNRPEVSAGEFKTKILQGREGLKNQEAIRKYLTRLKEIEAGLISRQGSLKPEEYLLDGLKQVIGEPIGAALIQNLVEDFPLPGKAITNEQMNRQKTRLIVPPGVTSYEEWVAFQTMQVVGAFRLEQTKKIVTPDPKNLGPGFSIYRQGNNRGEIVNLLRPTITRALPK